MAEKPYEFDPAGVKAIFEQAKSLGLLDKGVAGSNAQPLPNIVPLIRHICATQGKQPICRDAETMKADEKYVESTFKRALSPDATPGSYLVPVIQPQGEITKLLGAGYAVRKFGARIWPCNDKDVQTIPTETAAPLVSFCAPNYQQTADSSINFGQMTLHARTARGLVVAPMELFRTASVAFQQVLSAMLIQQAGKAEDLAILTGATSLDSSPVPTSLLNQGGYTNIVPINDSGKLTYADLTAIIAASAGVECPPPLGWLMHPSVFFNQILGMLDTLGRPIVQAQASEEGIKYTLFGYPVTLSVRVPSTLGSPANFSYVVLTNPSFFHIFSDDFAIAVSTERYFDSAQIGIRIIGRLDFGISPAVGVVVMTGVSVL